MAFVPSTITAPTLATWEAHLGGLTFGIDQPSGAGIISITGLGLTQVRSGDSNRHRDDGQLAGLDLLGGKTYHLKLTIQKDSTSLAHALMEFSRALQPGGSTEHPFWIKLPGFPLLATMCRVRKRSWPVDVKFIAGMTSLQLQLHSVDARLYGPTVTSQVGLPTPLGGMKFNVTFPLSFGGGASGDFVTLNNTGNIRMRPILTITGPCTTPHAQNDQTGWTLTFSNPTQSGYTLGTGTKLVIDLDARSVTLTTAGTSVGSPRESWVVAGAIWPTVGGPTGLAPGTNTIQFTSKDTNQVTGALAIEWAPAYLF